MKKISVFLMVLVLLPINLALATTPAPIVLDRTVVIVNDEVITQNDVNKALATTKQQLTANNIPLPEIETLKKQVLDNLINQKLQQQLMKKNNITASNSEINIAIANIAKANSLNTEQLKTELAKQGLDYNIYRKNIGEQIKLDKLHRQVIGPITVSDQQVTEFIKKSQTMRNPNTEFNLQDIVTTIPEQASQSQIETIKQQAQKIHQQITASNFASFNPQDLGWRKLAELPDIFVKQIINLKPGQITEVIEAPNGFHIIKLLETRNTQKLSNTQAKNMLMQQEYTQKVLAWLEKLRSQAYVKFVA